MFILFSRSCNQRSDFKSESISAPENKAPPQKKKKNLSISSFLPVDSPAVSWDCDVSVMYVRSFRRLRYHRAHLTEALHGVETCTGTAPSRFLLSLAHDLQDTSPPFSPISRNAIILSKELVHLIWAFNICVP